MARFEEVGVFPYSINEEGELVILLRTDAKSQTPALYQDFGARLSKHEPSIYFTAVRGLMTKSFGLFSENINPDELVEPNFNEENAYG